MKSWAVTLGDHTSYVEAETRSKARWAAIGGYVEEFSCTAKERGRMLSGARVVRIDTRPPTREELAREEADDFNFRAPIGTPVRYWTGLREGRGKASRTRTTARVMASGHAVVWVEGEASCIALTHVALWVEAGRP